MLPSRPPYAYDSGFVAAADFRQGHPTPPVAVSAVPAGALLSLSWLPEEALPPLVLNGLAAATRKRHRAGLESLVASARNAEVQSPALLDEPLDLFIGRHLETMAAQRRWLPQTTFREAANLCGALSKLSLYAQCEPIILNDSPRWKAAMRNMEQAAQTSQPHGQAAATLGQMRDAVQHASTNEARAWLALAWATSARLGDIHTLRRDEVVLNVETGAIAITFTAGKGAKFRGPYTVPGSVMPEWCPGLQSFLNLFPSGRQRLFATPRVALMKECNAALQLVDPRLTTRAVRRGALQLLAQSPEMTVDDLMVTSGHTSARTALRYLDWGRGRPQLSRLQAVAQQQLAQPPPTGPRPNINSYRTSQAAPAAGTTFPV